MLLAAGGFIFAKHLYKEGFHSIDSLPYIFRARSKQAPVIAGIIRANCVVLVAAVENCGGLDKD